MSVQERIKRRAAELSRGLKLAAVLLLVAGLLAVGQSGPSERSATVAGERGAGHVDLDAGVLAEGPDGEPAADLTTSAVGGEVGSPGSATGSEKPAASEGAAVSGGAQSAPAGEGQAPRQGPLPVAPGVKGVADTTIRIGLTYFDAGAVLSGMNAVSGGSSDNQAGGTKAAGEAAVELVNSLGGVAGRQIDPVWHEFNSAQYFSPSSRQQGTQRICADFTEDRPVFAFTTRASEENLLDCAAKHKTPILESHGKAFPSQARFNGMANYYYSTHGWIAERRERALGLFLLKHGFFDAGAKVGLMIEDRPGIREGINRGLKPVLAAAGITPEVEIVYPDFIESPWESYVLRLQSAGVTHVIFSGTTGGLGTVGTLMLRAAENQRYRPKWATASDHRPSVWASLGSAPAQLENVSGMGSEPSADIGADVGYESPQSTNAELCAEAMRKRGVADGTDAYIGQLYCDALMFLRAAFEHADVLSPEGMAGGVARLADTYGSPLTLSGATQFGPNRHDGTSVVRRVQYSHDCECFEYTTPPEPVPT